LRWKRNQFCRGWLITGDTAWKRSSGSITCPSGFPQRTGLGGLCIDEKGIYWETLKAMASTTVDCPDLIHVQIARGRQRQLEPTHDFNLTAPHDSVQLLR